MLSVEVWFISVDNSRQRSRVIQGDLQLTWRSVTCSVWVRKCSNAYRCVYGAVCMGLIDHKSCMHCMQLLTYHCVKWLCINI